jgi:uncharacterized protein (TIGR02466 family)
MGISKNKKYNQKIHKHNHLHPQIQSHFLTPIFFNEYAGISKELDIRNSKYYLPKGGQVINLQKDPFFKSLIDKIKISVKFIAEHWYKAKKGYKVDVVSLWVNSNESNQYHAPHNHTNTFMSGVIMLDGVVDKNDYPSLRFLRPYANPIMPQVEKFNELNSNVLHFKCEKDCAAFFPSYLYHFVGVNKNKKPRISIAFDTVLRGKYGEVGPEGQTVGDFKI